MNYKNEIRLKSNLLDIAVKYGFGSHESFTRAFKKAYGITPKNYRKNPLPVVLRTRISTFDRYILGLGEIGMVTSTEEQSISVLYLKASKNEYNLSAKHKKAAQQPG